MVAEEIYDYFLENPKRSHISRKISLGSMNCAHVAMVKKKNTLYIYASGTKKFKVKVELKDKGYRTQRDLCVGTNLREMNEILDRVLVSILSPKDPNIPNRYPKGFFIRKQVIRDSDQNFQKAKDSRYFHQGFIGFCKRNGFYCGLR